jgi:hypothetical protein
VLAVNTTVVAVVAPDDEKPLDGVRGANVRTIESEPDAPPLDRAVAAYERAKATRAPYLLHDADPLGVCDADAWARRFEGKGPAGELEVAVAETLARWRARSLDLPDYYVVVDPEALSPTLRHWYLGVLGSAAPARVVPGQPSTPVADQLGTLRPGPWWPELDRLLDGIDKVVPDQAGPITAASTAPLDKHI